MNVAAHIGADPRLAAQDDIRALRETISELDEAGLELVFTRARSHYAWQDRPVSKNQLRRLYDIVKQGATSMNCSPARFLFVASKASKARLVPALKPANVAKVLGAPVTVIVAYDLMFWDQLDTLFPHEDRKPLFRGKDAHIAETAMRNGTLQGAYMMLAARALGLDCGPISGFDNAQIDEEFFSDNNLKSNFLLNLGYADETSIFPKLPRLRFEEACEIL
ncbi:MAG: malonic semialdehyde reductase [Alphaproteobacteria bacterium]|nr:malonic semialdehyde reductase [Alphaproteobacteria bacterium]